MCNHAIFLVAHFRTLPKTKAYIPLQRKTINRSLIPEKWLGALGDANFSRHLTQNLQRESVEYRLRWVPNAKSSRWPCTIHVVCVNLICVR